MRKIENTNVAVTGGAGFLGSHLVNHLIEDRNCKVLVLDNLIVGRREFIHPKANFVWCDITGSEEYLRMLFERHEIKYVFSYAARPYVPDSYDRPLRTFDVNAMGAMKVINAAHDAGVSGILQVSSAELYGEYGGQTKDDVPPGTGRITEEHPVTPHSTYGAAKLAADAYVQVRHREDQVPCVALRQFNCVGERETHPYVVPEIISQLQGQFVAERFVECDTCRAKPGTPVLCSECLRRRHACGRHSTTTPTIHLGNNTRRDFMYAGDAVRMAVQLLEYGSFGEVYNLGSEESVWIYELAQMLGQEMGFETVRVVEDVARKRAWEIWHLQSDNAKLYRTIPGRPTVPLRGALRRAVQDFTEGGCRWAWERSTQCH